METRRLEALVETQVALSRQILAACKKLDHSCRPQQRVSCSQRIRFSLIKIARSWMTNYSVSAADARRGIFIRREEVREEDTDS